jgi:1-acyl-sn-glycerol-3-phosphate acyltransferase
MWILGRQKTTGRRRVPKEGGLLVLSNHRSDCDPIAVQVACPRPIRFMAKSDLWGMAGVRSVLPWLKCFPVNRGEPDKAAIKHAVALLHAGECVGVFPEGQLTESGELQPLKPGIALIIRLSGVPVICSDSGGITEYIHDGHNGMIFDHNSVEDLANRVVSLLLDEALAAELGRNGRGTAMSRYSWGSAVNGYSAIYESAVKA